MSTGRHSSAPPAADAHSAASADLEAIADLLEQMQLVAGQPANRSRIRRALEESALACGGPVSEQWWQWILQSGISLGLRCRAMDCTAEQMRDMAHNGGRLLCRLERSGEWCALSADRYQRLQLHRPGWLGEPRRMSVAKLSELLQGSPDSLQRCVVIEPHLVAIPGHGGGSRLSPLAQAWALLQPEMADIWTIVLFALVAGVLAMATPLAIEALVTTVTFGKLVQPIVVLSLMLLAFLAFQAAIKALQTYVVEIIQRRLFARVAADVAFRLPHAKLGALHGHSGRELVNRFFDIVTVQKVVAQFLLDGISVVLNTLIGMVVLGFYHPWLLGFDVVLLALIGFAIVVLGRGAVVTSIRESKCKYRMAEWLEDVAGCTTALRHAGAGEFALERTDRLIYDYLTARRQHFRVLMRQIVFVMGVQACASTALLGLGGWLVISGQLTLGQLVAAELIVTVIVSSFAKLGKHMEGYYDLMAAVDKLGHLFELPIEPTDGSQFVPTDRPAEVVLTQVACVDPDGHTALSDLSLTIPPRARAVMAGGDERAKQLLIDLLFGLRVPHHGRVTVHGFDVRELRPDVLRRTVALARDIEVFTGTIAENVHLERPDVSLGDVRDALHQVGLLDQLLALPEGLDTQLIATGHPLSNTQLRKLMLARAIVSRPTLLLIDGVLDALPDRELDLVLSALSNPQQPWTMLIATGRQRVALGATLRLDLPASHDSHLPHQALAEHRHEP